MDAGALRRVAGEFDRIGELIETTTRVSLGFGGGQAGRAYVVDGDALRRALEPRPVELSQWSRATAEIAAGLRLGADRYVEADRIAAERIG